MRKLGDLLAGLEPAYRSCDENTPVPGIQIDSRLIRPGHTFVAVNGAAGNGHSFIGDAVLAGASVVILERDRAASPTVPHVLLADTLTALPDIAAAFHGRPAERLRNLGISGTNGKTTTAHLVSSILDEAGIPHARIGTTGYRLVDRDRRGIFTTPPNLELQALLAEAVSRGATSSVMEVSSHALHQARIAPVRFHAAAMTSFSQDHLDYHKTMDAYLEAKLTLAREYLAPDALAVAAVDGQPGCVRFLEEARSAGARTWRVSRGAVDGAEILARDSRFEASGIRASLETPAGALDVASPLLGAYNLDNLMMAIALCLSEGIELPTIGRALTTATGAPGRLERVVTEDGEGPRVFVDYAHTPDAVRNALSVLRDIATARVIVVLGCGGERDVQKRPMMGRAAAEGSDRFIATSDNPRREDPGAILDDIVAGIPTGADFQRECDRALAIARAIGEASDDDVVLIAGKGHEDYQIVGESRVPFDDRDHVRHALAARRGAS